MVYCCYYIDISVSVSISVRLFQIRDINISIFYFLKHFLTLCFVKSINAREYILFIFELDLRKCTTMFDRCLPQNLYNINMNEISKHVNLLIIIDTNITNLEALKSICFLAFSLIYILKSYVMYHV